MGEYMDYDVLIIGAGPGGIFSAYELMKQEPKLRVAVFEAGHGLSNLFYYEWFWRSWCIF